MFVSGEGFEPPTLLALSNVSQSFLSSISKHISLTYCIKNNSRLPITPPRHLREAKNSLPFFESKTLETLNLYVRL